MLPDDSLAFIVLTTLLYLFPSLGLRADPVTQLLTKEVSLPLNHAPVLRHVYRFPTLLALLQKQSSMATSVLAISASNSSSESALLPAVYSRRTPLLPLLPSPSTCPQESSTSFPLNHIDLAFFFLAHAGNLLQHLVQPLDLLPLATGLLADRLCLVNPGETHLI
jgi:hypothetical protein